MPNEPFYHLAIETEKGWLHSAPYYGVVEVKEVLPRGEVGAILVNKTRGPLTTEEVDPWRGRHYDPYFNWTTEAVYCSEMIAKIMNLSPYPMDFSAPFWDGRPERKFHGRLGISPTGVFQKLRKRGFHPQSIHLYGCQSLFWRPL
ncbi:MAG: hypothetical protein CL678_17865 [Bdellovibrionaceae bacterium]|nr:hypothetical protein [Pseudobdellovibrionaceae bacterium]